MPDVKAEPHSPAKDGQADPAPGTTPTCRVDACDEPALHHHMCSTHYHRWKRNQQPLPAADVIQIRRQLGLPDDGPPRRQKRRTTSPDVEEAT